MPWRRAKRGLNRVEHRLHLRCELPHHTTLPLFGKADLSRVGGAVLMDQFRRASVSTPIAASTAIITGRANII